jgi:Ca-activated chloride channel family protein
VKKWILTITALLIAGCAQYRSGSQMGRVSPVAAPYAQAPNFEMRGEAASRRAALGSPTDELWVISRAVPQPANDDRPGTGSMLARVPSEDKPIPVPLKHTAVRASIAGYIATVDVTQQFHNPYDSKIEATYVFPLPTNAAVTDFVMTIGDRHIRGIIREKEEAQKIYNEAKSQGYVASLLVQDRPNVFTQSVANIEPGKQIDVEIRYFNSLEYSDGWYEFVFPMVIGPRFNPPNSTDGIGAQAHGSGVGSTKPRTEVPYLKPSERSAHDISLTLDIDAGVAIEQLESRNHQIDIKQLTPSRSQIALKSTDSIPNKDFVLRYKVAGERVKTAIMVQRDSKSPGTGGYFTMMIFPPDSIAHLPRKPLEMVYTIDVSGSMSGRPLEQALAATRWALTHSQPDDSFQIVQFASAASQMSPQPLPATPGNIERGLGYLDNLRSEGGTMMIEGIRQSLDFPHDENRLRFVTFLTDGYIGNEIEILTTLKRSLGPSRVFSFGVGSSTNRYLLDSMAKLGNGAAAYLGLNDDGDKLMSDYFQRISHPALTDLRVDFSAAQVTDVYPRTLPDLFVGRPIVITGRYAGETPKGIRIVGRAGGEEQSFAVAPADESAMVEHKGIASVWARMKIADIADQSIYDSSMAESAPRQIKQVALEYGLMSAFTSFVAVDSTQRTAGDHGTSVAVPVAVPAGVRYETTVPER